VHTIWQGRVSQTAAKYSEHAPMAATCCNACRACVHTNLIGLGLAAAVSIGMFARRLVDRARPS
jgi:hypothetical protein